MRKIVLYLSVIVFFSACFTEEKTNENKSNIIITAQNSGTTGSIRAISVVDSKTAWLGSQNGYIARTTNGGKTWQQTSVPTGGSSLDFRDIEAFSASSAVAISIGAGDNSRVYFTEDAGATWQLAHQNRHNAGFFNGIAFWDEQNGLLAGDPVEGKLFIMKTTDGGKSWQRIDPESIPVQLEGEYGFAASGTHINVAANGHAWVGTGGVHSRVFRSSDWGETWQASQTPMISGESSTGIFSVKFTDPKNGIVVGGDYLKENEGVNNVATTSNGGETWQFIAGDFPEFRSCVAVMGERLLAVGPSGVDVSLDFGQNWQTIDTVGYHTISVKGSTAWAAGAKGKVARISL